MNEHMQLMVDWIEDHLKSEFSLEKLSDYMGYSPYYCSFKFHQAAGISIRRYVLLRRLFLSAEDLTSGRKIIDIALDYGYSSQEAYSRAFKTVFGISPGEFQLNRMPLQSFVKLTINKEKEWNGMNSFRKMEVEQLQNKKSELFDSNVFHLLNGQVMYEEFKQKKLMGDSDYAPFNEAMCVNKATSQVFDEEFIKIRAAGHCEATAHYIKKVINPLNPLFHKQYACIVLWFGEDMFCQMNLLTLLAYLEQSGYGGKVYLNNFREDEFKVSQTELALGNYSSVYKDVLVNHERASVPLLPVMYQATVIYLDMLTEANPVTKFISKHKELPENELVKKLLDLFPTIGYGDSQYKELIRNIR